jgi:ferric-dicitrate binding protein FerR (iron transport regulator)
MKREKGHIDWHLNETDESAGFFSRVEIPWERSKEEVRESFATQMKDQPAGKIIRLKPVGWRVAAAAVLLLLAGITSFLRFYTQTVEAPAGQHYTHVFPDRSAAELNAATSLNYHPYWWRFSRKVNFEGEAFFKVEKGKKFEVASGNGQTIVLGTSFNIYSRDEKYQVTCLAGRVKVVAAESHDAVILNPHEKAVLNLNGTFDITPVLSFNNAVSWIGDNFMFTNTPLREVLDEIERQYGVRIRGEVPPDAAYTGNFSREILVNQVLNMVSKPFSITFVQKKEGEYELVYDQ